MAIRSLLTESLKRRGIDARQLKTLLLVYLKQDLRGGKAFQQFGAGEYIRSNLALLAIVGVYLLLGFMMSSIVFARQMDVFHYSVFTLTFTLFIIALAILSESGSTIFNEAEADVLGHLPISPRTHFTAKVANLFMFTLLLASAANLFPALAGTLTTGSNGFFVLAHAVAASLVALLGASIVVVSYGLLLRYVSRERFDSIVTYSQVTLVLVFIFSFQILPRVMGSETMVFAPGFHWYYLVYPPAWFSGVAMLLIGKVDAGTIALSLIAVLSLAMLGAVAIRKVASGYSSLASSLANKDSLPVARDEKREAGEITRGGRGLFAAIKALIVRTPAERAIFELVSIYFRRNREIKVRLYPSLAYFIFFPVIAIFTEGLPDPFVSPKTGYSMMGAAMICFVSLTAVEGLVFSEHFAASYIYRVAPIESLGQVHSGLRKAVMVWVTLPGFLVLLVLYSALWANPLHAALMIAPWAIMTPAVMMVPFLMRQVLPLARKYQKGQQTARNITVFMSSMIALTSVGLFQVVAINGPASPFDMELPYWLFMVIVAAVSVGVYALIGSTGLERRPVPASDD